MKFLALSLPALFFVSFAGCQQSFQSAFNQNVKSAGTNPNDELLLGIPEAVTLGEKAMLIVANQCNSCHSSTSPGLAGFASSDNLATMIATGIIVPGSAESSSLYTVMADGSMPINNSMPAEEVALVGQWIDEGATLEPKIEDVPDISLAAEMKTNLEILQAASRDLAVQVAQGANPQNIRYFSLAHLNTPESTPVRMLEFQNALSKLVNSLSWNPVLKSPEKVAGSNVLFRIQLSDYDWTLEQWRSVEARYTFDISVNPGQTFGNNDIDDDRDDFTEQQILASMKDHTRGAQPILRADWFVHEASSPELYNILMRVPTNIETLESDLTLNVLGSVFAEEPLRAAFLDSGISQQNRMMERHKTPYGAYWKSYDFASNLGDHNALDRPLGPVNANNPFSAETQFNHDGGEVIFNLPNGLQSYALVTATNDRIDFGPTEIVQDFLREDGIVTNGISCIACHSRGTNRKFDEVRDLAVLNPDAFKPTDLDAILKMYQPKEVLEAAFDEDDKRFLDALLALNIDGTKSEPVSFSYNEYEKDVTLAQVAHELSVTEAQLENRIERSRRLRRTFGSLTAEGGTLSRAVYEQNFRDLYESIKD